MGELKILPKRTNNRSPSDRLVNLSYVLGSQDALTDRQLVGHAGTLTEYLERAALRRGYTA